MQPYEETADAAENAEKQRKTAAKAAVEEQQEALAAAKDYLDAVPLSYIGLINQLEYEGFSEEAAVFAADLCGADWNEQAARQAEILSDFPDCSRSELIRDLENAGFTEEQAEYGAAAAGY